MNRGMCSWIRRTAARRLSSALALAALIGLPATARSAPPACQLPVSVVPPALTASQRTARVRVATPDSRVHLAASSGEIVDPKREGARALVAGYVAPGPEGPLLAIVAAVGGGDCGYSVVRLAEASGEKGQAASGAATLVVVDPPSVRADRGQNVAVYVFALEGGSPRRGAPPDISAALGEISGIELVRPGVWRAAWRVPAGEVGPAAVAAQFPGETSVSSVLGRPAGPAEVLEIEFDRPSAAPGDPTPVSVGIRVRDAVGNPTDAIVEVESDLGELGSPARAELGLYRAALVVPSALRGNRGIVVFAKTEGLSASGTLPLAPGPPASIRVTPPGTVSGDGRTTAQLEVFIVDAFDNPADEPPEGKSTHAEFATASRMGPGRWVLPYRPRRLLQDTQDPVRVTSGPASETLAVDLVAPRVSFSVGPKLGLALAAGQTSLAIGVEASAWSQFGRTQLGLVLEGSWWSLGSSSSVQVGGAPASYSSDQSYVPILLSAAWRLPIGQRMMLWTSLGGGAAWVSNTTRVAGQQSLTDSGLAPTASLAVSFGVRLGRGFPFVEVRGTWIGDPKLSTLTGSITPLFLLAGYRFDAG